MNLNEKYLKALEGLYRCGNVVKPRGLECRELLGYTFGLSDINDNIITLPGVATNIDYAKEELAWYLSGDPHINFSPRIHRVWAPFSDDGVRVNSNYGERIFGKHERIQINQWEYIKKTLTKDPDSRQAIININSAFDKEKESRDVVCTLGIQYFIRNKKLDSVVMMRSNDIYRGFRNDIYCFTELQKMMAKELGIEYGNYIHFAGSMHLYAIDYEKVEKLLKDNPYFHWKDE